VFDIGFQELVIIFVVALLVFGPKRLPEIGRTLGKLMVELRKGIQDAKVQMERDFDASDKKTVDDILKTVPDNGDSGKDNPDSREKKEAEGKG
jgi:sec-independent protein translocase protein TatB